MPEFTQYMDIDEREEWAAMLDAALNGSRQADQPAIDRLESMLAQASATGRVWPQIVERRWMREGMRRTLQNHAKSQDMVSVSYLGRTVRKTARRGVQVEASDGTLVWQQKLFIDMTWAEFDQVRDGNLTQIEALQINEVMAQKIAHLRALVPDSTGPQDACDRIGTTLDDVLSA